MDRYIAEAINQLLSVIRTVCDYSTSNQSQLSLHEPYFADTNASAYVSDCITTGWVSTAGSWGKRLEHEICSATGAKYSVAVTNGTNALRLALHLVGVSNNDEVLLPPATFVATANAISHLGAIPHFVDIEPGSLGICHCSLSNYLSSIAEHTEAGVINRKTGRRIAAVVPVHVFGYPCNISAVKHICDSWGLPMVEDSAEALGSFKNGVHCGLFGDLGVLSFNGNKLVTTGGGGALITNDRCLAERARHLSTTAKINLPLELSHDAVAWNDRMPNINAALGVAQFEVLQRRLTYKRKLHERYCHYLKDLDFVEPIKSSSDCSPNHWLTTLRITIDTDSTASLLRNNLLSESNRQGIHIRPLWTPLHKLSMYDNCPRSALPITENYFSRIISIPSSPQLLSSFHEDQPKYL